jgi:hypothetical protein
MAQSVLQLRPPDDCCQQAFTLKTQLTWSMSVMAILRQLSREVL